MGALPLSHNPSPSHFARRKVGSGSIEVFHCNPRGIDQVFKVSLSYRMTFKASLDYRWPFLSLHPGGWECFVSSPP